MSSIFISYRRDDAAAHAGRLHDRLVAAFGHERVFIDIDAIEPGQDFGAVIRRTLDGARLVVVVIGPRWLSAADAAGRRRLDDPDDFVRLEVAAALQRAVAVIPVLVGGARMPSADELPEDLQPLALRNAVELSDTRFHRDADALIEAAQRHVGAAAGGTVMPAQRAQRVRLGLLLGAALLLGTGGALWWGRGGREEPPVPSERRVGGAPLRRPDARDAPATPPGQSDSAARPAGATTPLWRWRVSHVLIAVPPRATDSERQRARERAERLAEAARRAPENFARLARSFSDDASSAERGGDLGYFRAGTMHAAFEDAVMKMRRGDIAGPIESPDGFHIVQLTSVQRSSRVFMNGQEMFVDVD